MKKLSIILLSCILAVVTGCKKDNATTDSGGSGNSGGNEAPTCSITLPQNGATFSYDENITVSVYAEDSDGSIVEVSLYLDNVGYQNKTEFPYNFIITSGILEPGTHTLKAVAKDNGGSNGETTITITIQQPATESPDFVSFSDGNIPPTWHTATWFVDNAGGYDDIFSLKIINQGSVTTTKTIEGKGYMEYYVKGRFDLNNQYNNDDFYYLKLYIDGSNYFYYTVEEIGLWKKYIIDIDEGTHTFLWEYNGVSSDYSCSIDAVKFTQNSTNLHIGDYYGGGFVGYLDNTRQHGYIISDDLGYYDFANATSACNNYSTGGYSDWRLPNRNELYNILKAFWLTNQNIIQYMPSGTYDSSYFYWTETWDGYDFDYDRYCGAIRVDYGVDISSFHPSNLINTRAIRSF